MVQQPITWSQSPLGRPAGGTLAGISAGYSGSCAPGSAPVVTRCSTQFYYLPPTLPTAAAPELDNTKYPAVLLDGTKMQTTGPFRNCTAHEAVPVRAFPAYALAGAHEHTAGVFCRSTEDLAAKSKSKERTGPGVYKKQPGDKNRIGNFCTGFSPAWKVRQRLMIYTLYLENSERLFLFLNVVSVVCTDQ